MIQHGQWIGCRVEISAVESAHLSPSPLPSEGEERRLKGEHDCATTSLHFILPVTNFVE